jgi:hypothetical protein
LASNVSRSVAVETATGKLSLEHANPIDQDDRRPQLAAALGEARRQHCSVAVAKLDRLSRDVHFISGLMAHKGLDHHATRWRLVRQVRQQCAGAWLSAWVEQAARYGSPIPTIQPKKTSHPHFQKLGLKLPPLGWCYGRPFRQNGVPNVEVHAGKKGLCCCCLVSQ